MEFRRNIAHIKKSNPTARHDPTQCSRKPYRWSACALRARQSDDVIILLQLAILPQRRPDGAKRLFAFVLNASA